MSETEVKENNLLERLEDYFVTEPERLMGLGAALVFLGAGLILVGLVGNVVTSAANGIGIIGKHADTLKTLADIYPSIPTWWIPESIVGALPALFILIVGFLANQTGKRIRRFLGKRREY